MTPRVPRWPSHGPADADAGSAVPAPLPAAAHDGARRTLIGALAGATGLLLLPPAGAQAGPFPSRPLKLIVPFPPGGPTDIVARPLAQMLSEALRQQVVVDNRAGAGGAIAAELVAKSPPDGYTMMVGTVGTHAINTSLYRKLAYDAQKDFTALGLAASAPVAMVVNASTPYQTVEDLVVAAARQADGIGFASAGNGTPGHLTGEMFAKAARIDLRHIPYKGSAPAITDLLGGQLPLMFDPVQSVLPQIQAGKLRALAVSGRVRSTVLPGVPTFAEAGVRDVETTAWWAVFGPAGLPADVQQRLAGEIERIVRSDTFRDRLGNVGVQPAAAMREPFADFQRAEIAKWGAAVRNSGASVD